jgi:chromosome partitioning protein
MTGFAPLPVVPRVLSLANQKGGVGKTTTAINLGTAMAAIGRRVLLLDLDPQGNASTGLGIERGRRRLTSYDLLIGRARLTEVILATAVPGLALVPATIDLSAAELELVDDPDRAGRLRAALRAPEAAFDLVLVDCPPSLGLLTVNALTAADAVLVPLQAEFFALEGLSLLLGTIERVRRHHNPALELDGIVLTMADRRNNLAEQVEADVRAHLGARVLETVIPRNVRVSEAPSHGRPVLLYDLKCAGSQAYLELARELLRRAGAPRPAAA